MCRCYFSETLSDKATNTFYNENIHPQNNIFTNIVTIFVGKINKF